MKSEFLKIAKLNPQKEQAVFENRKTMFPQIIEKKSPMLNKFGNFQREVGARIVLILDKTWMSREQL